MADTSEQECTTCEERVSSSPRDSPREAGGTKNKTTTIMDEDQAAGGEGDNNCTAVEAPPSKTSTPRSADNRSTDTKLSGDSGGGAAAMSTSVTISPRHKDPDRIKKDREREERVRQARERLDGERKKKLVELQEQQRQAQENREKQLEIRRRKIEDLRRREMERRAEVEKRRQERESAEKSRRETLLLKAEERVARYEAWKRGGQKGGRGHVLGFGSATPRSICQPLDRQHHRRSSSHTGLLRHSPSGSDSEHNGSFAARPQRRALSACSTVRRHCCVDINRSGPPPGSAMPSTKHLSVSTSVLYHKQRPSDLAASSGALSVANRPESLMAPPNLSSAARHRSVMSLSASSAGSSSAVRLRESKSQRKPRPASVAGSGAGHGGVDGATKSVSTTPRSKSTDRLARAERPRSRGAASASRAEEKEEEEKKLSDKPGVKMSRKTLERLSTPRQVPQAGDGDRKDASSTPRREPSLLRKSSLRDKTPKDTPVRPKQPKDAPSAKPKPKDTPKDKAQQRAKNSATVPGSTPSSSSTPRVGSPASRTLERALSPTSGADEDGGSISTPQAHSTPVPPAEPNPAALGAAQAARVETPEASQSFSATTTPAAGGEKASTGDITAEEYKARLAEKRRQARERAEREAEEGRRRKEEEERLEEERRQEEEEEQKRREEEAVCLAEEARRVEGERLQKAIEAEEARKAEEAARLEQERLAKEEAERKAREEAERQEQERQEKARREEEERLERKKRLEMIMKRVKTDNTGESKDSPRSVGGSPARTVAAPVAPTGNDSTSSDPDSKGAATAAVMEERKRSLDSNGDDSRSPTMSPPNAPSPVPPAAQEPLSSSRENVLDTKEETTTPGSSRSASPVVPSALSTPSKAQSSETSGDKPKFKSPLLQKLVEGKEDSGGSSPGGEGPRFKSPLLQNLLSKTRVGARMGLAQDYSRSSPDLSQVEGGGGNNNNGRVGGNNASSSPSPTPMSMSSSMYDMGTSNSASKEQLNLNEEKDVDTSEENSSSSTHSTPRRGVVANGRGSQDGVEESSSSARDVTSGAAPVWNVQDSGVGDLQLSTPSMSSSVNGHAPPPLSQLTDQALEDSSISLQSTDSTTGSSINVHQPPSTNSPRQEDHSTQEDKNFEELIDLSSHNPPTGTTQSAVLSKGEEDLLTFTTKDQMEGKEGGSPPVPSTPIIAFEETSLRKHQDVSDVLS